MGEVRTNVIYLTTHCNLDCSYCYERENRNVAGFKHRIVTSSEIDEFVEEVSEREANNISCVVIFGGEPLLKPDLMVELMEKFIARKSSGVAFDLITNGTLITPEIAKMLKHYTDILPNYKSVIQIEVSYDVSGQGKRVYPNGKLSDEATLAGISQLQMHEVPFAISYVVHKGNYDKVLRDVLYCFLKLKAVKVGLKWAEEDLEQNGISTKKLKKDLAPYLTEIYRRYGLPICEMVCGDCGICDKAKAGNNYCIPEAGIIKQPSHTPDVAFNHFSL